LAGLILFAPFKGAIRTVEMSCRGQKVGFYMLRIALGRLCEVFDGSLDIGINPVVT